MGDRVIFHLDMNAFFASVEQQAQPALRGKPIIVCGNPRSRSVVAACSYEAKAYGIKNGMSVPEARRLCPHVIPVAGDPEKYVDISRRIFGELMRFTPEVEIFSIDEAFLDVTDTFGRFDDSPEALARRMKADILRLFGLLCSVGIGPNKLVAKLASNLQKPDGLVRVRPEDIPPLFARLPVEALCGVGPRIGRVLKDWGILTCADLGSAPEALLIRRFGVTGRVLKRMGLGQDERPVAPVYIEEPAKSMGHAYTLPRNTPDESEIYGTLLRLSERVARRLREDRAQCRTIGLTLRYDDFSSISHHRSVAPPIDSGLKIYRVARALVERYADPLPRRVRLVGVGASQLVRGERQMSLLEEDRRLEQVDRCLDSLANRFGEFTVVRASSLRPLVAKSHGFLLKRPADPGPGLVLE